MKKPWLIFVLSLIISIVAMVLTTFSISSLNNYKIEKEAIADEMNFKDRLLSAAELMPFNDVGEKKMETYNSMQMSADAFYNEAIFYGSILVGSILLYNLIILFAYRGRESFNQIFGVSLIVSSLCLLYLGIQAPLIEIEAFNTDLSFQIPIDLGFYEHTFKKVYEGKIYYFYQIKSILELIKLLFTGGNFIVGIALLFFSLVFPIFKLLSSFFVLLFPKHQYAAVFKSFIIVIGKWSMADVFVAGIFLAYFAFSNMNFGVETHSETLLGLYFFLAFVILSVSSSYFIKRVVNH